MLSFELPVKRLDYLHKFLNSTTTGLKRSSRAYCVDFGDYLGFDVVKYILVCMIGEF